ncbi:hypothetical protein AB205_0072700 [Aquarana catesbeiana]|uniref:Uncharacterized protein n=1 Tax=Aquarana catesbeiana TaxID=8400 RepID=A0A2G9RFH3_AQUCT|nr:hypothetical protein AB205_0072700 [Aquarana catesbeiana]
MNTDIISKLASCSIIIFFLQYNALQFAFFSIEQKQLKIYQISMPIFYFFKVCYATIG